MGLNDEAERIITSVTTTRQDDLYAGVYRLKDNTQRALWVVEKALLRSPTLENYQQFKSYFNSALGAEKPVKPSPNDDAFYDATKKAIYGKQKYQFYLIWRYQRALKTYRQQLKNYQAMKARVRFVLSHYSKDERSYLKFVYDSLDEKQRAFFLRDRAFYITEEARKRHTHITGKSGYGKSELLKTLIYHYMINSPQSSVILFDPHGDIAEEVALFKEHINADRLVYIDPFLDDDYVSTFNPFMLDNTDLKPRTLELVVNAIYDVFDEILSNSAFTLQMETLLKPCITTLLLMGNCDITDLWRFMDDDSNEVYLQFAEENLYNPMQRDFLKNDFWKDSYNPTKQGIKTKIQSLLNSTAFLNMLSGKPTFDLNSLMNQHKVIVFNLSAGRLGSFTSDIIGRFLLAYLKGLAFQRIEIAKAERVKTHCLIDECQRYLTPSIKTILTETRKYTLHLTLAHQYYGQDMSITLNDAISANTGIKITGVNSNKSLTAFQKETEANMEEMKKLGVGEFMVKQMENESVKIKAPSNLVDGKNSMNKEQWQTVKQQQLACYYRRLEPEIIHTPAPEPVVKKTKKVKKKKPRNKPNKNTPFDIEL